MDAEKFSELMEGARQMRDHAKGKKVDGTRVVTLAWDPADHLSSDEDLAVYLEAALEEADPELIATARDALRRAVGRRNVAAGEI